MVIWLINNITLIIDTMSLFMPEIMYRRARVYFINKLLNSRILLHIRLCQALWIKAFSNKSSYKLSKGHVKICIMIMQVFILFHSTESS